MLTTWIDNQSTLVLTLTAVYVFGALVDVVDSLLSEKFRYFRRTYPFYFSFCVLVCSLACVLECPYPQASRTHLRSPV